MGEINFDYRSARQAISQGAEQEKDRVIQTFQAAYRGQSDDVGAGFGGVSLNGEQIRASQDTLRQLVQEGLLDQHGDKYSPSKALSDAYTSSLPPSQFY